MIVGYKYCGYCYTRYGNKLIWGAVSYVEGGFTSTYIFWGSSKKPIIKRYHQHSYRTKKEQLYYRIHEKRKSWSKYTEVQETDIKNYFPELDSQIGMYILARKLKAKSI